MPAATSPSPPATIAVDGRDGTRAVFRIERTAEFSG
jgi:hypothetical protein